MLSQSARTPKVTRGPPIGSNRSISLGTGVVSITVCGESRSVSRSGSSSPRTSPSGSPILSSWGGGYTDAQSLASDAHRTKSKHQLLTPTPYAGLSLFEQNAQSQQKEVSTMLKKSLSLVNFGS